MSYGCSALPDGEGKEGKEGRSVVGQEGRSVAGQEGRSEVGQEGRSDLVYPTNAEGDVPQFGFGRPMSDTCECFRARSPPLTRVTHPVA
jgi:hypothetical protein